MNILKQNYWIFFALILVACFSWYYAQPRQNKDFNSLSLSSRIDSTASDVNIRQFDKQGHLVHTLKTPLMHHLLHSNIFVFQNPHIVISEEGEPSWKIDAKLAKAFNNGVRIVFSKHVVIHQQLNDKTAGSVLKTEMITYFPKEKKASTDRLVTFEQPGNFIQSLGMNAYLEEKEVELLHQARGRYAPAKN